MRAVQRLFDCLDCFLGSRTTDLGPRPCTEPLSDLEAQLETTFCRTGVECLGISVGNDEIDP